MKNFKTILFSLLFLVSIMNLYSSENWMRYPAISPSGEQIAFSFQGDIFIVDSQGGKAVQLTRHRAYDFKPVWSPDGKFIAFASDRFGNFDIFYISVDGGKAKRLTFHSAGDIPTGFTPGGESVIFYSSRMDSVKSVLFPSGVLPELYSVNIKGGLPNQILTSPAIDAVMNKNGDKILYHDQKGYENRWRKHHISSVARDIWLYDLKSKKHKKLTEFKGEDRNPLWSSDQKNVFFISEKSGSFNVWEMNLNNGNEKKQITFFTKNPVRFLSISKNDELCFGYNGKIFIKKKSEVNPLKVNVDINPDESTNPVKHINISSGITQYVLSPNGKEVAYIARGEVFVTSVDYGITKRITNTPEQERSVSFSPDGRKLLFAGELNNSWNLYEAKIESKDEPYFYASTLVKTYPILESDKDTFQPLYSPNGEEVAFLETRTTLRVINLKSKKVRTVLSGDKNYSYSDGDQWFSWSPDSKWLLVQYLDKKIWIDEVGLVDASCSKSVVNLTKSGYADEMPIWSKKGDFMIWASDKYGMRSHGSWGAQFDVYAMFFTKDSFDKFTLSKAEYALKKEMEKKNKKDLKKGKSKKEEKKSKEKEKIKNIAIDLKNIEDRVVKLTVRSSDLVDLALSPDEKTLVYISRYKKGFALWSNVLREKKVKLVTKFRSAGRGLVFDKKGKNVFVLAGTRIVKVNLTNGIQKPVSVSAEMELNSEREREYMFEHVWRQVKEKFYDPNLHNIDWKYYKEFYKKFLPSINNNYDFAELLSEMLGELNASHTGSGYRVRSRNGDSTASMGLFFDTGFNGPGLKVAEVIEKGPFDRADSKVKTGVIIRKIDGIPIVKGLNYYTLLNRKSGKYILVSLTDPSTGKSWTEKIKPISLRRLNNLLYERWVKSRREETEKLSSGKIGYVHIRGMDSHSFRTIYSEIMGRNYNRDGIVVDTRFNGGGWLHNDLVILLSGKKYMTFYPRKRAIGIEPMNRWVKKSIVVMSESNYSDAHMFPFSYKALKIGKLVGMPVPGTGTAVWWETLQDRSLYFGIPQIGMLGNDGKYLENQQLYPDYRVLNDYESVSMGKDKQLRKAVEVILKEK